MQRSNIPWLRIVAEGLAIVVSILLAFAIDAWWEGRNQRRRETALLTSLHSDFRSNQAELEQWTGINGKIIRATEAFLDRVASPPAGTAVAVPDSFLAAVVVSPTYDPITATVDAMLSSGDLSLIRDETVRRRLAAWPRLLLDTHENELAVRDVVHRLTVPLLAERVSLRAATDSAVAWSLGTPEPELSGSQTLRADTRLESALALHLLNTRFVRRGLSELQESQAELLRAIEAALGETSPP